MVCGLLPFSLATVKSAVFKKQGQKEKKKKTTKENLWSSAACKVKSQQAEFENFRALVLLVTIAVHVKNKYLLNVVYVNSYFFFCNNPFCVNE